jgi:hypothetical protein
MRLRLQFSEQLLQGRSLQNIGITAVRRNVVRTRAAPADSERGGFSSR